ncbi:MAG TPA: ribulose-phosphate 3-epimerase [Candidatus Bipolaricaulota bacterium]
MSIRIAPSVLAADFSRLAEQIQAVEQTSADRLHVDVMDGRFVPTLSMGPLIVEALARCSALPLEVHLMIVEPERQLESFAQAGAACLIVHQETCPHLHRTVQQIKDFGLKAGVALNPATPARWLQEILPDLDLALVMTVNPGFGGQRFIESSLGKIRKLREWINGQGLACELEVDGGINAETGPLAVEAGADVLVAGSAVFGHPEGIVAGVRALEVV